MPIEQAVDEHHGDADGYRRVGDIEGGPVIAAGVQVDEVGDGAETQPIDDVAQRAADDQADRVSSPESLFPSTSTHCRARSPI